MKDVSHWQLGQSLILKDGAVHVGIAIVQRSAATPNTVRLRTSPLVYSRRELLALKNAQGGRHLEELKRRYCGCKARQKENRRRFKPSFPSTIMGNVKSLPNKINKLTSLENHRIYRVSHFAHSRPSWHTKQLCSDEDQVL